MSYEIACKFSISGRVRGQKTFFLNTAMKRSRRLDQHAIDRAKRVVGQSSHSSVVIDHLTIDGQTVEVA